MIRHRIALALALLAHCSPAADIAPLVSWSVETNALQPSQRGRKDLELVRGETAVLECQLLSGGAAINLAEATSVLFRYTPANPATNSTHYVVTGAVHSAATGKVRVRWTPAAAPAQDRLQYEIAVGSSTSTVARAWGLLRLLPGVGDDSTGSAVERSTIDWSTVDSQNEGDAPWPTDLADLDDVDTTGRAAGEVVSWNGTNYVHVAQGGHDAATVTGGMLTLSGQQIGLSTSTVRSAVSGIYLPLAGGAMTGSIDIPYGTAIRWRDSGNSLWYSLVIDGDDTLSIGGNKILTESSNLTASQLTGDIAPDRVALTTSGDMLYRNASSALARVGIGTAGQVLQSSGSAPVWATMVGLVDRDYGDVTVSASGQTWTIDSAVVTPSKMSDAARTMAFTSSAWEGPTSSQTPGWAPKSYAVAGLNAVVAGPVGSATQAAGTFASIFQMPSDATAWRSAKAISLSFIGDSTTSTAVKYRLRVYIAGSNTALYDVSDQVLASTTTVTTVNIAGSSLATFTADAVYTIVVDASVTTSGFYFVGQPRIQVLK